MGLLDLNAKPSRTELRWFGALLFIFFALVGAIGRWRFGSVRVAVGAWSAGLLLASAYYALRPLRRPMYTAWVSLAYPVGWSVSHLAMASLYYVVLTPIGLVLRLLGHDLLKLDFGRGAASYWERRRPVRDVRRYFEPF